MTNYAAGIDVSLYQGSINWNLVKQDALNIKYAFVRATVGDFLADNTYHSNYNGAIGAGIITMPYHVIRMHCGIDSQLNRLFNFLGTDYNPNLPIALDCETTDGKNPRQIETIIRTIAEAVETRTGTTPVIYTGDWWWNPNVPRNTWCQHYPLWTAYYSSAPKMPIDWSEWKFWQYSSSGSVAGINARVDLNWFNGTEEEMLAFFKLAEPPEPPVTTGLYFNVATSQLYVRAAPTVGASVVGSLSGGTRVQALDVASSLSYGKHSAWIKIATDQWACVQLGGSRYMEVV